MNTEQFWAGEFGDKYTERNEITPESRMGFWRSTMEFLKPRAVLEIGCNAGHNLLAIRDLAPAAYLHGVEINDVARHRASEAGLSVSNCPAQEVGKRFRSYDLVFTAGLLIHIAPADLNAVVQAMIEASEQYVMAIEYAACEEIEIEYRGEQGQLWKRPYGEIFEQAGLRVIDWGDAGPGFDRCTYWICDKLPVDDTQPGNA